MKVGSKFKISSWILSTMNVRQKVLCPRGVPSEMKTVCIYVYRWIPVMFVVHNFGSFFPNLMFELSGQFTQISNRREHLYTKPV